MVICSVNAKAFFSNFCRNRVDAIYSSDFSIFPECPITITTAFFVIIYTFSNKQFGILLIVLFKIVPFI